MKKLFEIPVFALFVMAIFTQKIQAQETLIGTTDIPAYLPEVQAIPDDLPEAMRRTYGTDKFTYDLPQVESFYKTLEDRVQAVQDRYLDFYGKKQATATYSEDDARAEIDKNPIVAAMGGSKAIENMSEAEARQAATKAANDYIADPFAASGVQSDGMKALYQKIISDPAYAERFNKMSEKEKEAELRKFMANDQPARMTPEQTKAHQEKVKQQNELADKVRNAQEIQLKMMEWNEQIQAALDAFGQSMTAIWQQPGNHEDISAQFAKKYEAVPIVELGEYGHDKDPEMMKKLSLEEAAAHRQRAANELRQTKEPLKKLQADYVSIAGDYMAWLKANRSKVNGDMNDFFNGTHTEIPLANFEMSLLGLTSNLIDHHKKYTADAANWERRYLELARE